MSSFFASCPKHLELLLVDELRALGASNVHEKRAGVSFEGDLSVAYRALMWSRLANHILQPIAEFESADWPSYYEGITALDWPSYFSVDMTFAITVDSIRSELNHKQYAAQLAKDAVVDKFRAKLNKRPDVDASGPNVALHILIKEKTVTVSLNLSGESLHRRGYRLGYGAAPLKENLAAAILVRANWPRFARDRQPLVDPMCGSGTFLIEAALIAANIAPGLLRDHFSVKNLRAFDRALWQETVFAATSARAQGLKECPKIIGYDGDSHMIHQALDNIERAGLTGYIHVEKRDLSLCTAPAASRGLLIANPPYGERLGELATLQFTYQHLGDLAKREFAGWQLSVLTANTDLSRYLRLAPDKIYKFFNGALACDLLTCQVRTSKEQEATAAHIKQLQESDVLPITSVISDSAQMFKNKLLKNLKHLQKWAKREGIDSYRVYDADLPEYALAIDVYNDHYVHVQEYAAPKTIDPEKAKTRLFEAVQVLPAVFHILPAQVFVKTRQIQKGKDQYQQLAQQKQFFEVNEGPAKFLLNFSDYLDTGLFLDTRLVRQWLYRHAKGKLVLNLFAYTGTATVYAALGGASRTVSVDLSNTYTEWAKRNLALNGLTFKHHEFVQADCLYWLATSRDKFDVILLDPPSFSNSKKTTNVLDIERDHVELIRLAVQRLSKNGVCLFVTNKHRFKLDTEALSTLQITDVTAHTLPEDFKRYGQMHQAFEIRQP